MFMLLIALKVMYILKCEFSSYEDKALLRGKQSYET